MKKPKLSKDDLQWKYDKYIEQGKLTQAEKIAKKLNKSSYKIV